MGVVSVVEAPFGHNPAAIGREIADLQAVLLKLAEDKTERLYLATFPSALPDVYAGIRISQSRAS